MEKGSKSLTVNAVLNILRTISGIIIPLITMPYVTRVLQAEAYGIVNHSASIISYFQLIAGLGISAYAVRELAGIRDDRTHMETVASQIYSINILSTLIAYISLAVLLAIWRPNPELEIVIIIQSILIGMTTLGVEWVFTVYEDFLYITVRSIVIQILALVLIFIFVKERKDYINYVIITTAAASVGCIVSRIYAHKYFSYRKVAISDIGINEHIKPILMLFANAALITIYLNSDITMLGLMKGNYAVGLYSVAVKIYTIAKTVLSAVVAVIIPRLAVYLKADNNDAFNRLANNTFKVLLTLLCPSFIGLFLISQNVIHIIAGESYIAGTRALQLLSISLLFATVANFFVNAIMVTCSKEKEMLKATALSALLNVALNFVFIPLWSQDGAAATTLLSELTVMLMGVYYCRDLVSISNMKNTIKGVLLGCVGITAVCKAVSIWSLNIWIDTVVKIIISVIVYGLVQVAINREQVMALLNRNGE